MSVNKDQKEPMPAMGEYSTTNPQQQQQQQLSKSNPVICQQSKQKTNNDDNNNNNNNDNNKNKDTDNSPAASATDVVGGQKRVDVQQLPLSERRNLFKKQKAYEILTRSGSQMINNDVKEKSSNSMKIEGCLPGKEVQDIDEWQLLEVDESSGNNGSGHCENNNNNNNNNSKLMEKMEKESLITVQKKKVRRESDTKSAYQSKKKYINIDPLNPQIAKKQTLIYLCTALYALLPLAATLATFTLIALIFTRYFPITLIYFAYTYWNRNTCNKGGQRKEWFYQSKFWSYLAAYFPIKLRYSESFKLDPKKNYILNFSPHGIAAFGSVTTFATNGLNFSDIFPGIKARFMVHETSFMVPLMREVFAFRGDCSVNSKSIDYMLTRQSSGNLLAIVVGGLAEADLSDSETLKIVVAERKGFVKKALVHGANIIPCIAFGENSVYKKVTFPPKSLLNRMQSKFYQLFKFKHPIYYGHSILSAKLRGVMPYKRPITVVMDDPIEVERKPEPSQKDIDELHAKYIDQLKAMYHANKDLCSNYDKQLELV